MKYIAAFLFILLISCKTASKKAPVAAAYQSSIESIVFGSGGGFSGKVTSYTLTKEGKIMNNGAELKSLGVAQRDSLFKEAEALLELSYSETKNMNAFLEIKTVEKSNRFVWPVNSPAVDSRLPAFHKKLTALTR